jgi:hypothetical protein
VYIICVVKMQRFQWVGHMAWIVLQQISCRTLGVVNWKTGKEVGRGGGDGGVTLRCDVGT